MPASGRCLAARGRALRLHDLGYAAAAGLPELREAILAHVAATRGIIADASQVVVLPSTSAAITLLARQLIRPDRRTAWIEDPGYDRARDILRAAGADRVTVPVDQEGMTLPVEGVTPPRLIYVTPSHHYPTGTMMTLRRRLAVIEAARQTGAIVLEDDHDSDFLAGPPVAALQSIDRSGVIAYAVSAWQSGLQLAAWFVSPAIDDKAVAAALARRGFGPRTLSDFYLGVRPGPGCCSTWRGSATTRWSSCAMRCADWTKAQNVRPFRKRRDLRKGVPCGPPFRPKLGVAQAALLIKKQRRPGALLGRRSVCWSGTDRRGRASGGIFGARGHRLSRKRCGGRTASRRTA